MTRPSKGALVRHVLKPHGDFTVTVPEERLLTWDLSELEQLHVDQMHKSGRIPHCDLFGDVPSTLAAELVPNAMRQHVPAPVSDDLEEAPAEGEVFEVAFGYAREAVLTIGTTLLDLANRHPDDLRGLAATQVLVGQLRADLALLLDELTPVLWEAMGDEKEVVVDNVGVLTKRSGKALRGWDHDAVWSAVRRAAIANQYVSGGGKAWVDGQTYNPKRSDIVNATIDAVRDVITKGSYKVNGLRDLGLDPDEVAEVSWGKRSIQITGGGQ